jgi:hypothetical protein
MGEQVCIDLKIKGSTSDKGLGIYAVRGCVQVESKFTHSA